MKKILFVVALIVMLFGMTALSEEPARSTIAGSNANELANSFVDFGFPAPTVSQTASGGAKYSAGAEIKKVMCSYEITADSNGEIIKAVLSMQGKDNGFFDKIASMKYDAANETAAKKFIDKNTGKEATTRIGDARFTLEDTSYFNGSRIIVGNKVIAQDGYEVKASKLTVEYTENTGSQLIAHIIKNVNIRAGDNADSEKLGYANPGEEYVVTQQYYNPTWHQIDYNGQEAYVSAKYCEIIEQ